MPAIPPFHLAFPVTDLETTRVFFVERLGCQVGRQSEEWIDFDFFGHQLSAHLVAKEPDQDPTNPVDGKAIPVRHFGAVLPWATWEQLAAKLTAAGVPFVHRPQVRFAGKPGEQGTFFVRDPSGNVLEFKSFQDPTQLFHSGAPEDSNE